MTSALHIASGRPLEGEPPHEVIRWASSLGPVGFGTGFGAEGCVLIDLIARHDLPVEVFTLDTGLLFPETYALWKQVEAHYGITIKAVRPAQTVEQQAATQGASLWQSNPDRCCELRKLEPLRSVMRGYSSWVTAIRREQTPERAHAPITERDTRFDVIKVNPLAAWTHDDVWSYLRANDVPFNPLHERGYPSIGCEPCTSAVIPGEALRAGRWRGSDKTECGLHITPSAKQRS